MRFPKKIFSLVIVLAAVLAASCGGGRPAEQADLVLTNGAVYTMDAAQPWATAVAVAKGKVLYVGDDSGALRLRGGSAVVADLGGKMVLPAFQDSHIHLVTGGVELGLCNLNGLRTKEDVFEKIKAYAAANPGAPWVTGGGWDLPVFPQA
ncbi:MAG: amidohydrolase family protein, partial [Candidatus Aminicenantes bacterium]|nr:amidohydrolase family protein [Candidatus Aminicenantes bacterium]